VVLGPDRVELERDQHEQVFRNRIITSTATTDSQRLHSPAYGGESAGAGTNPLNSSISEMR